jgi:hypothetical protein
MYDSKTDTFSKIEQIQFKGIKKSPKYYKKAVTNLVKNSLTAYNDVIPYTGEKLSAITETKAPGPIPEHRNKSKSILKKWWFWTLVGGCVATMGGVLIFTDIAKSDPGYNVIKIK